MSGVIKDRKNRQRIAVSVMELRGRIRNEPALAYCTTFACGRILSLVEQMAGNKCTRCMNEPKPNINLIIKTK